MIGHDLRPNGVIQLYSFKQPISRLQVKKMIALRKFIGGCLDGINLQNKNLVTVVGAMSKISSTAKVIESRASMSETDQRQMIELQSYVKTAKKEISAMYVRATTEPGFMDPPPEPEYENLALKAFLEKKAAEEAAEKKKEEMMAAMQEEGD